MVKRGDLGWPEIRRKSSRLIAYVAETSGITWNSLRETIPYIADMCGVSYSGRRRSDIAVECFYRLGAMGFNVPDYYIEPWRRRTQTSRRFEPKKASDPRLAEFYDSWEWRRLRYDVLLERGRICECCGADAKDGIKIVVDHIKPLRFNWRLRLERTNLQVLCDDCNMGKGSRHETDWRRSA